MTERDVVGELALRSRALLDRNVERFGPRAISAHDQKLESVRHRITTLGGDARSLDVLVGVMVTLEELPLAFGRVRTVAGSRIHSLLVSSPS